MFTYEPGTWGPTESDALVADVGCANTVLFAAAQRLGYNTDVAGMVRALSEHGVGAGGPALAGALALFAARRGWL